MALNAVAALLAAQRRSFWNRLRRDSALGGAWATGISFALAALLLLLPGLFALGLGHSLGAELRIASDRETLAIWNGLQALFTVGFALLGSFRLSPSFDLARLGHFPISPLELLLAEVPAAAFEVFPLLGGAAIVLTNLGLASALPGSAAVVALLTLQGLAALLALLFLAAALRRTLLRRPVLAAVALLALAMIATIATVTAGIGGEELRRGLLPGVARLVAHLPGSLGYGALLTLRDGRLGAGLADLALSLGVTLAALLVAAAAHRRERAAAGGSGGAARRAASRLHFTSPAGAIAALHTRQLLASRAGRINLALPALFSAAVAGLFALARSPAAARLDLPPELVETLRRVDGSSVLAWSLVVVVLLGHELWMNQFGWDRAGIRTLLQLPIDPRDLLRGKLLGQARVTALQGLLAAVPLLLVFPFDARAVGRALAGGVATFYLVTAAGQVLSLRFPRGVARRGAAHPPLYLSWIPSLLGAFAIALVAGVSAIAGLLARWAPPLALAALAALLAAGYRVALPALAQELDAHRERLLRM